MKIVRISELAEVRWKNGGGVTREIAESRDGERLVWRLSMADVASDGPFSDFAGLTRILTVIDGTGLELLTPHGTLRADFAVPIRFDGGLRAVARLTNGAVRDLNLMFDPERLEGDVAPISGPCHLSVGGGGAIAAVHCLSGAVELAASGELLPGDTALIEAGRLDLALAGGASALLVTLTPLSQTDSSSAAMARR